MNELVVVAAITAALTVGLLVEVDLPRGGRVSLGSAALIALVELLDGPHFAIVVATALALAWLIGASRRPTRVGAVEYASAGVASAAAVAANRASSQLPLDRVVSHESAVALRVLLCGVAFLAIDHVVRATWVARSSEKPRARELAPVYVTLLCASALVAVAATRSVSLAVVAVVPLLVTRYSFHRYALARSTCDQTALALSLLPEVAGLSPLGHGERTAVYATGLAEELGFDRSRVDLIATAARLHHIGYISLHEPAERKGPVDHADLGRVAAEILRETGFLAHVAALVEAVHSDQDPTDDLEVAVIRVASTLDDVAGIGDASPLGDPFMATLARHSEGAERTAAIALLHLHDTHASLLSEARGASTEFTRVAANVGDASHDAHNDCR